MFQDFESCRYKLNLSPKYILAFKRFKILDYTSFVQFSISNFGKINVPDLYFSNYSAISLLPFAGKKKKNNCTYQIFLIFLLNSFFISLFTNYFFSVILLVIFAKVAGNHFTLSSLLIHTTILLIH